MIGMALSSLTGLASQILITRAFGTSAEIDAFYAANRIPEILFNLMAGGALASAFIPTFTTFLTRKDPDGAWRLASSISWLVILTLTVVSLLAWLIAPWLVERILTPGFEAQAQINLTVKLLRIMLISPVIFGVSGLIMGILNAHQRFAAPALAPAAYRFGIIFSLLVLVPRLGVFGLAWGSVLGSLLHLLLQIPSLIRISPRLFPGLGLGNPAVREVGRLMAPRLIGVAVVQLNFLINTIIASGLPEGSLSSITYAFQIMLMPEIVIAQAIAIAALPTFSAQVASGDLDDLRSSLMVTLRGLVYLALPASLGLMLLREPVLDLLFRGGEFQLESTSMVSWALLWYAAGLLGHSILEIITRAFYAMNDTRTPVLVGTAAMTLNAGLSLLFASLFTGWGLMPHGGLALANSLATALESAALLLLMRRRLNGLQTASIRRGLLASLLAALMMSAVLFGWLRLTSGQATWLVALGGIMLGLLFYWGSTLLLRAPEASEFPRLILRRVRRQSRPGL